MSLVVRGLRWWPRIVGGALLFGVLLVALTAADFEPDALRLGLLVALAVAVSGLVRDGLDGGSEPWSAMPEPSLVPAGSDARLAAYVRLIEGHLTAATPEAGLRDRLAALVDERLARTRGLGRGDPAAAELLGTDLLDDLAGPPRRLRPSELDDYLRRIEEL